MKWLRPRLPSPALVVSIIALIVAMGGTGYAALHLPKNSVGSRQIKKNAVTSSKIKNGAVTGADIKDGSLSGSDLNVASLGSVPAAANATHASTADSATNAGSAAVANSLASVSYVVGNTVTAPAPTGTVGESPASIATCPAGTVVIGSGAISGGEGVEINDLELFVNASGPVPANSVRAYFDNFNTGAVDNNVATATCAAARSVDNPDLLAPAKNKAAR